MPQSTCMLQSTCMHDSVNLHACLGQHACINQHACMHQSTNIHQPTCINQYACMHQPINPDNDNILISSIVICVVTALVLIILLHIRDIFMKHATYQKCAVSYGNLESTRWGWPIDQRHFAVTVSRTFHRFNKLWSKLTFDDCWMNNVLSKPKLKVFLSLVQEFKFMRIIFICFRNQWIFVKIFSSKHFVFLLNRTVTAVLLIPRILLKSISNTCNMDGWVRILRPFNSISVISRRWKGEHERLCAMKHRLGSGRISPPAGFEPTTPWSEVESANRSATRMLLHVIDQIQIKHCRMRLLIRVYSFLRP